MDTCECGKTLGESERVKNPRTYVATKPDGSQNKYQKTFCDTCDQKELEKKGVKEAHD